MFSFVCVDKRVHSDSDVAWIQAGTITRLRFPSSLAAATTTSSDVGRHRFMDSFKVTTATR